MIRLEILGTPAAKGSPNARVGANGHVIVHEGKRVKSWEGLVREAARDAVGPVARPPYCEQSLRVAVVFRLARPNGHWGKGKRAGQLVPSAPKHPRVKPDIDKLIRATLDPLIGIVYDDDSRIVALSATKVYADVAGSEGATIGIDLATESA